MTDAPSREARPEISVIVGSVEAERSIHECIASIIASGAARSIEIIVVDASRDRSASLARSGFPSLEILSLPPDTLTPKLWSEGLARSKGRAVAFTTAHCAVPVAWLSELHAGIDGGATGAGGPVTLASGSSMLDAAIYLLRYSAFLPGKSMEPRIVAEIAGDNAMYARSALDRHSALLSEGFWEVELHRLLRDEGAELILVPRAAVSFGRSFPLATISRHRFAHGRHFGKWRVTQQSNVRWRILILFLAVPFILLWRIASRVRNDGGGLSLVFQCGPIVLWLGLCWAFGEAVGAWDATPDKSAHRS